jgi:hypothetical protein
MKRSSTFMLGSVTAMLLAACSGPKNNTSTPGGAGSESGAATSTPAPADTAMTGGHTATDSAKAGHDTTAR